MCFNVLFADDEDVDSTGSDNILSPRHHDPSSDPPPPAVSPPPPAPAPYLHLLPTHLPETQAEAPQEQGEVEARGSRSKQ